MNSTHQSVAGLMTDDQVFDATRRCIEAWNALDVEAVLATYSDDVVYRDPGTRGSINGKEDLRRYLSRYMKVWNMHFRVTEERRIAGSNAQVCLWDVEVRRRDGDGGTLTAAGMDIIHVAPNGQLTRDEVYFDRTTIAGLIGQ